MGPRTRSLVAAVATVAFLIFWVWALVSLRALLPASPWLDLLFFAVGGTLWGVPLFPLLKWAEKGGG